VYITESMAIKVSIVEDKTDIRLALEQIIDMAEGYDLTSSYRSGEEAMAGLPIAQPDIVLMDINLGGMTGIECVKQLKTGHKNIKFMMCTVYEEDEQIFEALRAGASGYILKKTPPARLLEAIKELYEGGAPMSSQIAAKVVMAFQGSKPVSGNPQTDADVATLSNREREILDYLSKGLLYKEIAAELGISQETVRKHVYNIYEKLHVGNRIEAVNKFLGR
jgi:DNA-binding NarL/FixJ family response regulator